MKVLLVDPPFQIFMGFHRFYYPLGLGYIAAVLNERGHPTTIFDAEHAASCRSQSWVEASRTYHLYPEALAADDHPEWRRFRRVLETVQPDLVGLGVLSVKISSALKLASIVKGLDRSIPVVVGGDHPTVLPEDLLRSDDVDYAVRGEGEYALPALADQLAAGSRDLRRIEGLSHKEGGGLIHNPRRPPIEDLDALPFPALESLVDVETYRAIDLGVMLTTRGCPCSCTYCGIANTSGRGVRARSVDNVLGEIGKLHRERGVAYYSFRDASFTLDRGRTIDLCRRIPEAAPGARWECATRVDLLDDNLIAEMKAGGCATVRIGIETGSEQLMRRMNRRVTLSQIREAARMLHRHDMHWSAYFLFGVPGETRGTIEESLRLIAEIDPPFVTISNYSLIPGTRMFDEAKSLGLVAAGIDWARESNQSLSRSYSSEIGAEEYRILMERAGEFVDRHNEAHRVAATKDARDKE